MPTNEKLRISAEATPSVYTNHAEITLTTWDFRIKFGEIEKLTPEEVIVSERVRVAMSPQHAKVLSRVLAEHVANYEKAFGEIQIEAATPKQSLSPFGSFPHDPGSGLAEVLTRSFLLLWLLLLGAGGF
jgi:hypothetical protein